MGRWTACGKLPRARTGLGVLSVDLVVAGPAIRADISDAVGDAVFVRMREVSWTPSVGPLTGELDWTLGRLRLSPSRHQNDPLAG
jgi:hypothetical protein